MSAGIDRRGFVGGATGLLALATTARATAAVRLPASLTPAMSPAPSSTNVAAIPGWQSSTTVRDAARPRAASTIIRAHEPSMKARAVMLTTMSPSNLIASVSARASGSACW